MKEPLDVAMDTAGIARITINRPKRANSFDAPLAAAMLEALDWLANDPKLRVLVLLGSGRTFCAGLDLKALPAAMAAPYDENYADALKFANLLHRLHRMPVPTLAVVPGAAIGLGVGLVACCDIALASEAATFRLPEVRIGILPAIISPYVMAAIGPRPCQRYFLSGETFDAAEAHRLGLVQMISSLDNLGEEAGRIVGELLAGKREAQRACKELIEHVRFSPLDNRLIEDTARRLAEIRASEQAREAVKDALKR